MKSEIKELENLLGIKRCEKCALEVGICRCHEFWGTASRSQTQEEIRKQLAMYKPKDKSITREYLASNRHFQNKLNSKFKGKR